MSIVHHQLEYIDRPPPLSASLIQWYPWYVLSLWAPQGRRATDALCVCAIVTFSCADISRCLIWLSLAPLSTPVSPYDGWKEGQIVTLFLYYPVNTQRLVHGLQALSLHSPSVSYSVNLPVSGCDDRWVWVCVLSSWIFTVVSLLPRHWTLHIVCSALAIRRWIGHSSHWISEYDYS